MYGLEILPVVPQQHIKTAQTKTLRKILFISVGIESSTTTKEMRSNQQSLSN